MLADVQELYAATVQRRAELERATFEHPPTDWAEFQRRLGQWQELSLEIQEIERIVKGVEGS